MFERWQVRALRFGTHVARGVRRLAADAALRGHRDFPRTIGDLTPGNLSAITGNFSVTDLDVGDTLTASVVGSPVVQLNGGAFVLPGGASALTAGGAFAVTGATSNGGAVNIGYSYDPAAANLDFLQEGQQLVLTYHVKVYDGTDDQYNSSPQTLSIEHARAKSA